jgi:hypothetical protein
MTDDQFGPVEVTGRWVGFYRYRSEQSGTHPIVAEFRQNGNRITGEMYDQITERSAPIDSFLETFREDISLGARRNWERVMEQLGTRDVVVMTHLPDTSDIDGKIRGNLVKFTKSYRGSYDVNWSVHDRVVASGRRPRHKVHYSGHLDPQKMVIAGGWFIRRRGLLRQFLPPRTRGSFELYKKS